MNRIINKKVLESRVKEVVSDHSKVYEKIHERIMQALHIFVVIQYVRDYQYRLEKEKREYNMIIGISRTALENYLVLQFNKLFEKTSFFTLNDSVRYIKCPKLKFWFDNEVKNNKDIKILTVWRQNFSGHYSKVAQFAPQEFGAMFKDLWGSEGKIREFLLNFLCQIRFAIEKVPIHETMFELCKELSDFVVRAKSDAEAAFLTFEMKKSEGNK